MAFVAPAGVTKQLTVAACLNPIRRNGRSDRRHGNIFPRFFLTRQVTHLKLALHIPARGCFAYGQNEKEEEGREALHDFGGVLSFGSRSESAPGAVYCDPDAEPGWSATGWNFYYVDRNRKRRPRPTSRL